MTSTSAPTVLPRDVVMEKTARGVRYRLPRRQLGLVRFLGLVPIVFGAAFVALPIWFMIGLLRDLWHGSSPFHALLVLFVLLFVFAGLKPVSIGMLLLFGRCTVELTPDLLRAVDSAGPFRNVRKAPRKDIRSLEVNVAPDGKTIPGFLRPLERMGALEAKFDGAKPMPVALGYPREWLVALGNEITSRINEDHVVRAGPALPPAREVVKPLPSQQQIPLPAEDIVLQPKQSKARLEETATGITLVLPPEGVWRGAKGLFVFGLVWCAFMTLFSAGIVFASRKADGSFLPFAAFSALFWLIGIAMLLGAINMGRRRALLIANGDELRIAQQSLFGKKARTWCRAEVAAIRADRSGMEVNNRPVIQLQVHSADGKKTGLFSGRDEVELQWIATVLRKQLGLH